MANNKKGNLWILILVCMGCIITTEAACHNLSSASGFNDDVCKEDMLVNLYAGDGAKPYFGFLATNQFWLAMNHHLFICIND